MPDHSLGSPSPPEECSYLLLPAHPELLPSSPHTHASSGPTATRGTRNHCPAVEEWELSSSSLLFSAHITVQKYTSTSTRAGVIAQLPKASWGVQQIFTEHSWDSLNPKHCPLPPSRALRVHSQHTRKGPGHICRVVWTSSALLCGYRRLWGSFGEAERKKLGAKLSRTSLSLRLLPYW